MMCDVFICSDDGVGLCDTDRQILQSIGQSVEKSSDNGPESLPKNRESKSGKSADSSSTNSAKSSESEEAASLEVSSINDKSLELGDTHASLDGCKFESESSNHSSIGSSVSKDDKSLDTNNNKSSKNRNFFKTTLQKTGKID